MWNIVYLCMTFTIQNINIKKTNNNITESWTTHVKRPDDTTLSCYQMENKLWKCIDDSLFIFDRDYSY